ncbi:MAG: STAS domain-containing protein [Alphaproteobacteria bacterium]|nr:STAS domain-containing protein [Alphaproteobacteria bacterium]
MKYTIHDGHDGRGGKDIVITGRMTFADHKEMRDIIAMFSQPGFGSITFDLSGVEFIDSAAMGMLLLARETAISRQSQVTLKGARDQVKRIMAVAKFDALFTLI